MAADGRDKGKSSQCVRTVTLQRAAAAIIIHKTMPCINGLKPTDCNTLRDKPQPMRNSVNVKPALARPVK